ncbi:DUF3016 domain-containing protein [Hansschlegelia quercus]|uniref:DUF3016 domain-containing protein n=1 Tax=Hansschlegelia quercus TaxID=2528245 RepID=UPI0013EF06FF|nr:DUF3016 domain-containing protein [Hansschlegelia quercus]
MRAAPSSTLVDSRDFRSASEREGIFRELSRFLQRTGDRLLPPGRSATIEILSVRPGGQFEPWRQPPGDQIRVLRDVTPPRIMLRYAVTKRGRTLARGEEQVTDIDYLNDIGARASSDRLAYEKSMLRDWLRDRLVKLKPARG